MYYDQSAQFELQNQAISALKRIRSKQIQENAALKPKVNKLDNLSLVFEEYDQEQFTQKLRYDMSVYNYILENNSNPEIQAKLTTLYETINAIYEYINIKPEMYNYPKDGFETERQIEEHASQLTNNFINTTYYNLSPEERDNRYKNQVIFEAREAILNKEELPEAAIERSQKQIIFENLIKRLSFPNIIQSNIEDLMESDQYAEVFDQQGLINLYEQFQMQVKDVAKLVTVNSSI